MKLILSQLSKKPLNPYFQAMTINPQSKDLGVFFFSRRCQNINMPNRSSKPKRPADANKLAKAIVDLSTGEAEEEDQDAGKDPAAVALGRKGGLKGGKARAKKLTAKRRSEIAKNAAKVRWSK